MELISNREVILQYYIKDRIVYDGMIILALILQMTPLDEI